MYVSDHPLSGREDDLAEIATASLGDLAERETDIKKGTFAGMISDLKISSYVSKKTGRKGTRANFTLEDTTGTCACVTFNVDQFRQALFNDAVVKITGRFSKGEREDQIMAQSLEVIEFDDEPGRKREKKVILDLAQPEFTRVTCDSLVRIVQTYPGNDRLVIHINTDSGKKLESYIPYGIDAKSAELMLNLNDLFGRKVA